MGPTNLGKRGSDVLFRGRSRATLIKGKSGRRRAAGILGCRQEGNICGKFYTPYPAPAVSVCVPVLYIYELEAAPEETGILRGVKRSTLMIFSALAAGDDAEKKRGEIRRSLNTKSII